MPQHFSAVRRWAVAVAPGFRTSLRPMRGGEFATQPAPRRGSWRLLATVALWLGWAPVLATSAPAQDRPASGATSPEQAAAGDATQGRARELVQQLGDPQFAHRERAMAELFELGSAALPELQAAARSRDAEVRQRASELVQTISRFVAAEELAAFERDVEGRENRSLPGFEFFAEHLGRDREARAFFVAMHRAEPDLMRSLSGDSEASQQLLEERSAQLDAARFQQSILPQSAGALFFVSAQPEIQASSASLEAMQRLAIGGGMRTAVRGGPRSALLKKLLALWLVRTAELGEQGGAVQVGMAHDLPEAMVPALKLLERPDPPLHYLPISLLAVARFGDKERLPALAPYLNFEGEVTIAQFPQPMTLPVRDVALAASLHLTGQDLKAYGFRPQPDATLLYDPMSLVLPSEDQRQQALKKWKELQGEPKR